jgi:hypothetical protein
MTHKNRRWHYVLSIFFVLPSSIFAHEAHVQRPSAEELLAMDRDVIQAFLQADAQRYGRHLSDNFFMYHNGYRATKDYAIGMVNAINCDVKDDWQLTAPQVTRVNDNAYVLSYRMDIQASCTSGDILLILPTPVRAATLWVYSDHAWRVAYHGENQIRDPNAADTSSQKTTSPIHNKGELAATSAATDPLSQALMAAETAIWRTWQNHDASTLGKLTLDDISFVNIFGDYFANKTDTIANWTGPYCDVSRFTLSEGLASLASPSIGVLTATGSVDGSCGGQDFVGLRVYATSVYLKESDGWKWAFGFNSP